MVHAVDGQFAGCQSQFGGQFHARGSGTNDADVQGMGLALKGFVVFAQEGIEHQVMKAASLLQTVQEQAVV
ncbi:MAG TPA: hypothetical protein VLA13_06970, partial [Massilibacterium sp.]|nr:hypothetical protein [Massilibacterium sp.]